MPHEPGVGVPKCKMVLSLTEARELLVPRAADPGSKIHSYRTLVKTPSEQRTPEHGWHAEGAVHRIPVVLKETDVPGKYEAYRKLLASHGTKFWLFSLVDDRFYQEKHAGIEECVSYDVRYLLPYSAPSPEA